jgi:2-methylcitrate dehydratase PrpD
MSEANASSGHAGSAPAGLQAAAGVKAAPFVEALARFAATASSEPYRDIVALQVADSVIALLAGMATKEGQSIRVLIERTDGASALGAAAWLAANMRLTEIDDIHRPSAVTASAIVLPAALAMHPFARVTPGATEVTRAARFADALFVGQELSIRLALALGGASLMTQGWWPSYLVAPFGAAAAAGRMMGLPAERMRHALALALAQTPQQIGRTSGTRPGRWLLFGNAVRSGCLAALAAADGIDGDIDLLSQTWLQRIGGDNVKTNWLMVDATTANASDPDARVITQVSVKPHCSAKQTLAAIHGLRMLIEKGLDPATIESIELAVPRAYAAMLDREPPTAGRLASLLSARGQLAFAALCPASLDDVARETLNGSPDLAEFAARVQIKADPSLDALYPGKWPARLKVRAAGTLHEIAVDDSPGDPSQRFGIGEIEDKARRVLGAHPAIDLIKTGRCAVADDAALDALYRYFS